MATETKHSFVLTAKDKTAATLSSVGSGFTSLGDKVNKVGGVMTVGLGAVAAAGATVAGTMAVLAAKSFESLDALGKFSDRIGVTTEALVGLRYAASQTAGVTDDQLDTALQRMTRRVSQAAAGTGEAVKVLDELNLSATELNQLSPDKQFSAIADAMNEVDNQSDKVRLTFGLFDSEGVGLVNTLSQGSEGLAQFATAADQLGLALDRGAIAKIESANDSMDNVKKSATGVGNAIAVSVAPTVTGLANLWVENVAKTTDWAKIAETTVNMAVKGFAWMADGLQGVVTVLQFAKVGALSLKAGFANLFINSTEAAATFLNFFGSGLKALTIGSLELVRKLGEALALLPSKAGEAGDSMVASIDRMQNSLNNALTFDADSITAGIQGANDSLEEGLTTLDNMVNAGSWGDKITELHTQWELEATATGERVRNLVADAYAPPETESAGGTDTGDSGNDAAEQSLARLASKLETVHSFLASEEEAILNSYSNRQIILEESLSNGLITESTYANQTVALEAKKQGELTALAKKNMSERAKFSTMSFSEQSKNVIGFLEANTGALAKESKTWFKVNQGLSIANAVMNTSEAVTKTLASYPAPLNFALAGVVLANGIAQVAQIKSQTFDGGSSSSSTASISSGSSYTTQSDTDTTDYSSDYTSAEASYGSMVTVQIIGDVTGFDKDELVLDIQDSISENINSGDMTIIEAGSRQAALIRGAA